MYNIGDKISVSFFGRGPVRELVIASIPFDHEVLGQHDYECFYEGVRIPIDEYEIIKDRQKGHPLTKIFA